MLNNKNAQKIIELLNINECETYYVGGCVRDSLLNKVYKDIDFATSGTPEVVSKILKQNNIKTYNTGLKHGTVTAVINEEHFEITTFRIDAEYKDNRHPSAVTFVKELEKDLGRRDFTINAMAYDSNFNLIDLFGGRDDLKNRVIKTVGDPDERFTEDALRILRALRFASVLDFTIEQKTKESILKNKNLLKDISSERIYSELIKLLCGENVFNVLCEYRDVFAVIIPELECCFDFKQITPWHKYDVYTHIIKAVELAPVNPELRLALLLHDIGKPSVMTLGKNGRTHFKNHAQVSHDIAKNILLRLKTSNKTKKKILTLIKYHQHFENIQKINPKEWFNLIGPEYTLLLFDMRISDLKAHNLDKVQNVIDSLNDLKAKSQLMLENNVPYRLSDLQVNGNDLVKLGFVDKEISTELNNLLFKVLNDEVKNEKEVLLSHLKQQKIEEK